MRLNGQIMLVVVLLLSAYAAACEKLMNIHAFMFTSSNEQDCKKTRNSSKAHSGGAWPKVERGQIETFQILFELCSQIFM